MTLLSGILLTTLAGAVGVVATHRWPRLRAAVVLLCPVVLLAETVALYGAFCAGETHALILARVFGDMTVSLRLEPLGMLFMLTASSLWVLNSLYSLGYMRSNNEQGQTRFYAFFAVAMTAAMGLAMAENLFTLFCFYELLTISTYPLVTHQRTRNARRGGRVYLGILTATSILLLLPAILWTQTVAGSITFTPGGILAGKAHGPVVGGLLLLYLFGIGKAALMPVHRWLPAGMVAPTPVSAFLHAVAVVKAGVFSILKIVVYIFGVDLLISTPASQWALWIASGSILIASAVALTQDHLKRLLAYSTISQLGYVTLGAVMLAPISIMGAAMHIAAHAFGKITLFFAAGSIYISERKECVSELDGIGRKMPWTMAAFTVGVLTMIGAPPTAGFLSKWLLLQGAMDAKLWGVVFVLVVSTLLNAGYFLPIIYRAFFKVPQYHHGIPPDGSGARTPLSMTIALCSSALGSIVLFCFPEIPLELAQRLADGL